MAEFTEYDKHDAMGLAELIRNGEISAEAVCQEAITRLEKQNPKLNAVITKMADLVESQLKDSSNDSPFYGVPFLLKDAHHAFKGTTLSQGSNAMKEQVSDHDAEIVSRYKKAGLIVIGKTNTPEFKMGYVTEPTAFGPTRNPWNTGRTPGGSSGGAAVAAALGMGALHIGTDGGGSIRIPAGTCGLVGYKPPYGRNSDDPPFNLDFYCHTGPLARNVSDAIALQNVMCGPHPKDVASLRPKLRLPAQYPPIKDWKIAFSMDLGFFEVDPDVQKNTLNALDVFRDLGATVEEVDIGWDHRVLDAGLAYLSHIFGAYMATYLKDHADKMTNYVRQWAEEAQKSTAAEFLHTLEVVNEMYATVGPLLERYRVLVCPTNALPAVPADFDHSRDTISINGKSVNPALGWVMTTPFNSLSRCPVLTVPTGHASNGVPTSIQIVGRTYTDKDVFQAGMAYESAAPKWFSDAGHRPGLAGS